MSLGQAAEEITWSHNQERQAGLKHRWGKKVFPIQSQEHLDLSPQGSGQDMGILGVDDPEMGGDLLLSQALDQVEVESGDILVEPEEGGQPELPLNVPLGLSKDEATAHCLGMAMAAQGQE